MFELKYPHLFSPITLAGVTFKNRIFSSPTGTSHLTTRHFPISETNAYYERRALGGAAAVCVGDAVVDSVYGRFNNGHIALDNPEAAPSLFMLSDSISRHGAIASIELSHAGSHAHSSAAAGVQLYGPMEYVTDEGFHVLAMDEARIYDAIEKHAEAARLAVKSGFGMITVHGGHGWLITQFMSPITNQRTDKWGGSPENRCRLAVEICKAIRKAVGPDIPIEMRISGSECNPAGYDIDEGIEIAKQLDGHLDLIHVSAGCHEVWDVFTVTHPDMFLPDGANVKYAAEIKKHVKQSKVATVGALADPELMEEIIASGKADVVELARALFADPDLPVKARMGQSGEIRKCMRCLACFSHLMAHGKVACAINPEMGRERDNKWEIAPAKPKKVLVAGGGIAGMQAALTARSRGHEVVLCEKTDALGGVLRCEHEVSFKRHLTEYLDLQARLVAESGAEIRFNAEVTPELVREIAPDAIVAAFGSRPVKPRIPGIDSTNVFGAEDVYYDTDKAGASAIILGGGLVGTELAIHLTGLGKKVTIIEMLPELNDGGNMLHGLAIRLELARQGIEVRLSTKAVEITAEGVLVQAQDGDTELLNADSVIYAVGQRPLTDEAEAIRALAPEFYQVGDCLKPKNITEATKTAFNAARDLGRL